MGEFQQRLKPKINWNFLAPRRAHNRADAAAAHLKRATNKLVSNFYLLSQVSHLAFANSKLKHSYLIEADYNEFEEGREVIPDTDFMRQAFGFRYFNKIGLKEKTCNHQCKDKAACGHTCCKGQKFLTATVSVEYRNGETHKHDLRLDDDPPEPITSELQPERTWARSQSWNDQITPRAKIREASHKSHGYDAELFDSEEDTDEPSSWDAD